MTHLAIPYAADVLSSQSLSNPNGHLATLGKAGEILLFLDHQIMVN
jgi:hypothetical protein